MIEFKYPVKNDKEPTFGELLNCKYNSTKWLTRTVSDDELFEIGLCLHFGIREPFIREPYLERSDIIEGAIKEMENRLEYLINFANKIKEIERVKNILD